MRRWKSIPGKLHSYPRHRGYSEKHGFSRGIMIAVIAGLTISVISIFFLSYAATNTNLIVELKYKGNPDSGIIDVHALSGQGEGLSYVGNGSSVRFVLHNGIYTVYAFYTNSTGYVFHSSYWTIDLTNGNIFFPHYLTIELSNNTAW